MADAEYPFYHDRASKADYVWNRFRPVLEGRNVLDVGAGEQFIRRYIENTGAYTSVGVGDSYDVNFNLDSGPLPFPNASYDTVLCLDVLEHLENIHSVFDDICRIARETVLLSLPNPWAVLFSSIKNPDSDLAMLNKYYGLPIDPPEDRHRWFFNASQAREFISGRAARAGMRISEMSHETIGGENRWRRLLRWLFFRRDIDWSDFYASTLWALLEREGLES